MKYEHQMNIKRSWVIFSL